MISGAMAATTSSMQSDLAGMNLDDGQPAEDKTPPPKMTIERSAIVAEVREREKAGKGNISLVVVGACSRPLFLRTVFSR